MNKSKEITLNRFNYGKNWQDYYIKINNERISVARKILFEMIDGDFLKGKTFLDIGCGSGIMSLAALQIGAAKVHSFDYFSESVETTKLVKEKFAPDSKGWIIEKGDILDPSYAGLLGKFDIVYSWSVLHLTGDMWRGLKNASELVCGGGKLYIAISNDQGFYTKVWKVVKKIFNQLPFGLRHLLLYLIFLRLWGPTFIKDFIRFKPFSTWKSYAKNRGMSAWNDLIDWVGGYPFEAATSNEIVEFVEKLGFKLNKIKTCGKGHGNNEFVFIKSGN